MAKENLNFLYSKQRKEVVYKVQQKYPIFFQYRVYLYRYNEILTFLFINISVVVRELTFRRRMVFLILVSS
ncbi:Uncharacterised protein [Riemerella anatipestifer]|nr:Uncharacterised protein [Riemerella anatipestifer]